jgi:hypothetical protein
VSATEPDRAIAAVVARDDDTPRHHSLSEDGVDITDMSTVPELTVTDGLYWHPAGTDGQTRSDMCIAEGDHRLGQAMQLDAEWFLAALLGDESMPHPCHCAV